MSAHPRIERPDLLAFFRAGLKPASAFGMGLEYERFGVFGLAGGGSGAHAPGAPLPIQGRDSVLSIFDALCSRFGWAPKLVEGLPIELSRGTSRITLEPGGQMELSGAIHTTIAGAARELGGFIHEVREVSEPLGVRWLAAGTHPTAELDEIAWLSKHRYEIMKAYLPTKGPRAHQMMKGTCGGQVNLDFSDEQDAMEKMRAAMGLTPIIAAMFANSPITARKVNGYLTQRFAVWLETDPDRCGMLPFVFTSSPSFDDYVDWALTVPMFFLVRRERWIPMNGMTFAAFMEHGFEGETATIEDWELHLSTLFPDVRLKGYIELRGTDSVPPSLILAHAALWKGLFYGGEDILAAAYAPIAGLSWRERVELRSDVCRLGLRAQVAGRPVIDFARELVALAEAGLNSTGSNENTGASADAAYLAPIQELVLARGITPAEDLLALLRADRARGLDAAIDHLARLDVPA
jgi:glutamate--cysteine ligase